MPGRSFSALQHFSVQIVGSFKFVPLMVSEMFFFSWTWIYADSIMIYGNCMLCWQLASGWMHPCTKDFMIWLYAHLLGSQPHGSLNPEPKFHQNRDYSLMSKMWVWLSVQVAKGKGRLVYWHEDGRVSDHGRWVLLLLQHGCHGWHL